MGFFRALNERAEIRTLLTNSAWLLGDRVVRTAASFVTGVLLARYLAPENYGEWVYGLAFAALFLPLSTLGLERIAVRELARDEAGEGALLGTVWLLRLLGGLVGAGLAAAAVWWFGGNATPETRRLVALLAGANVLLAFEVIDWRFQARGRFRPTTVARCGVFLLGSTARVALAWRQAPLEWLAYATFGELALSALVQTAVIRASGTAFSALRFKWSTAQALRRAAAPLLFGEVAVLALLKLDVVILGAHASGTETGYYGAAVRLAQVAYFLPVIVVQVFSPQVARCASDGEALALTQRVMNLLLASALAIALGLSLGAPLWVRFLFGRAYAPVAPLVALMAWGTIFAFVGCGHSLYLVNRGRQKAAMLLNLVSSGVNVALFATLIPRWGAMGAAVAGVAAGLLTTVPALWLTPASRALVRVDFAALRWVAGAPLRLARGGFTRVGDQ